MFEWTNSGCKVSVLEITLGGYLKQGVSMRAAGPSENQFTFCWRVFARQASRLRRSGITPGIKSGADTGVPPLCRHTCGGTPPLHRILQGVLGATASVLIVGLLAGCGSEDTDSKPATPSPKTTSASPSPSVSPPPSDAPDLNDKQQLAFKRAVNKYAEFEGFVDEVGRDPEVTRKTSRRLASLATNPAVEDFSDGLDDLIENDVHVEGKREVEWTSPMKVTNDKVTFTQCRSPGDWALVKGNEREPQTTNTIRKVTVIKHKGNWFIKHDDRGGQC